MTAIYMPSSAEVVCLDNLPFPPTKQSSQTMSPSLSQNPCVYIWITHSMTPSILHNASVRPMCTGTVMPFSTTAISMVCNN